MNPEEIAELKQLIEFLKENGIGEFDLERGDLKVRLKFAGAAPAGEIFRRWRIWRRLRRRPNRRRAFSRRRWRMRIRRALRNAARQPHPERRSRRRRWMMRPDCTS